MENSLVGSNPEFKQKSRGSNSDSNSSRDENSSNTASSWNEHRRDHGKNRERGRDNEWNRDRNYHGKNRETIREEENRKKFREDQQQQHQLQQHPAAFHTYGYAAADHSYNDTNKHASTMMNYNFMAAVGSPWVVNPMDGITMPQNVAINPSQPTVQVSGGLEVNQNSGPPINSYAYMGMPGDSNMFGMMGVGNYCQYGMMGAQENLMINPVRGSIKLSKCTLIPPNPNAAPPKTRKKPFGCKTIYVCGLPEKITDEIIKEIFGHCGDIDAVRMSSRYCHVQFKCESTVDKAIYFSGFKLKVEHKDESGYNGRIHVDYAQSKEERDNECQVRAVQREARHRQRRESDYYQPPTPPPIVHYSDHEAAALGEKLRVEDTFQNACSMLIRWLERGECNKRNAGTFYSMIQSTNSHVRRLINEKSKYEDGLIKAKLMLQRQMQGILLQFSEIEKVFNAACLQKVWDHFTKPQRKNIVLWKKQTGEIKSAHVEEVLNGREEDEMELSDDDNEGSENTIKDLNLEQQNLEEEVRKLQKENDELRRRVEAVENEIEVIKRDNAKLVDKKDEEIQNLKLTVNNLMFSVKRTCEDKDVKDVRPYKYIRCEKELQDKSGQTDFVPGTSASSMLSVSRNILEKEARIIGVVSSFLQVHPFGANLDYICSYLHMIDSTIKSDDLVNLLRQFPTVFREDSTGIGASLGKVWKFLGFNKS